MKTLLAVLVLLASTARADFIDFGNITLDTATGLEWMDVDQTFTVVYSSPDERWGTEDQKPVPPGWRFATEAEMHTLADEWFIAADSSDPTIAQMFGPTYRETAFEHAEWTVGFYGSLEAQTIGLLEYQYEENPHTRVAMYTFNPDFGRFLYTGQWWVRDAASVPEPSSLLLLGLATVIAAVRSRTLVR